jgi:hypothetical protein
MIPLTGIEILLTITDFWRWWVVHLWSTVVRVLRQMHERLPFTGGGWYRGGWPGARGILS